MSKAILGMLALVGGICIAVQAPVNAQLASGFKNPIAAASTSFFVGFAFLVLVTLAFRVPLPAVGALKGIPSMPGFSAACWVLYSSH